LGYHKGIWFVGSKNENIDLDLGKKVNKIIQQSVITDDPESQKVQVTSHQKTSFNMNEFYRVCSKITFNCLAHIKGHDFVLQKQFDPIRNWIINGGKNKFTNLISEKEKSPIPLGLLPNKSHNIMITVIKSNIIGLLSLYGESFIIMVVLLEDFKGEFFIDGIVCDWLNRKEYDYLEYLESIG